MPKLVKRSLQLAGHATSLALEEAFWEALEAAAAVRGLPLTALVGEIDAVRAEGGGGSLASACRVYALRVARE